MGTAGTELISVTVQVLGACLFCCIFAFLWNRSGVVYFGLWSLAWLAEALALLFRGFYDGAQRPLWLCLYAGFVFVFVIVLVAAAQAGLSARHADWRTPLKMLVFFPIFLLLVFLLSQQGGSSGYHALQGAVFSAIYFYNFAVVAGYKSAGGTLFRLSLFCLSLLYVQQAVGFLYFYLAGIRSAWVRYHDFNRLAEFTLGASLTFFALAMWIEIQKQRIAEIASEMDRVRRESLANQDLDNLTGLLNQAALAKRMEDPFTGVVAVCDMDNFKDVNDRYGHLVGDETLRNIGHLIRSSIRAEDEAFRWGGDEFVILFHNQNEQVVRTRMREIEGRLRDFRVRGYGALSISFSWGTVESGARALRETLDAADHQMYSFKRERKK
jgi:diguanylate cyclase (GGDEF)-like protein